MASKWKSKLELWWVQNGGDSNQGKDQDMGTCAGVASSVPGQQSNQSTNHSDGCKNQNSCRKDENLRPRLQHWGRAGSNRSTRGLGLEKSIDRSRIESWCLSINGDLTEGIDSGALDAFLPSWEQVRKGGEKRRGERGGLGLGEALAMVGHGRNGSGLQVGIS